MKQTRVPLLEVHMSEGDADFYRFDHWYARRRGVPCLCPTCRRKRREEAAEKQDE